MNGTSYDDYLDIYSILTTVRMNKNIKVRIEVDESFDEFSKKYIDERNKKLFSEFEITKLEERFIIET